MIEVLISSVVIGLIILGFLLANFVSMYLVPSLVFGFLLSNVELLKDNIPVSTNLHDTVLLIYVSSIYIGTIYGAFRGFISWLLWMNRRRAPKITFKMVEPIVGIAYDAGNLFFNILVAGFASLVVVASFPISVPILITCFEDRD
jgi:hypothetical protein